MTYQQILAGSFYEVRCLMDKNGPEELLFNLPHRMLQLHVS